MKYISSIEEPDNQEKHPFRMLLVSTDSSYFLMTYCSNNMLGYHIAKKDHLEVVDILCAVSSLPSFHLPFFPCSLFSFSFCCLNVICCFSINQSTSRQLTKLYQEIFFNKKDNGGSPTHHALWGILLIN